jgi:hypothetical protein
MDASVPAPVSSHAERASSSGSPHAPSEEEIARAAAVYDGLPPDLREAFDEVGREIGQRSSRR